MSKINKNTDKYLREYTQSLRNKYKLNNNILFIQTPQFMLDSFNIKVAKDKGCYAYPPAGLQCLIKALEGRKLKFDILDLNYLLLKRVIENPDYDYNNWLNILDEYLDKNNPSIIGITCISVFTHPYNTAHPLYALLRHLKEKNKHILITGGPIATNNYDSYLKADLCHFVVTGEGENKINYLFNHFYNDFTKKDVKPINGIFFKHNDEIYESIGEKDIVELKGNLIDTYKYIRIENYNSIGSLNPFSRMAGQNKSFAGIQLNRGCRANCKFCGVIEFMGKGLRQYPVSDVLAEMKYLIEKRNIRHYEILDDDFLGNSKTKENVIKLLKAMVILRKNYGISWSAGNGLTANSLTKDILKLMLDSGCVGFRIGIESGNDKMLKIMRKPASITLLKKTATAIQEYPEMFVAGNYIIGLFEEETFKEMMDTFSFSNNINLDWSAYTTFQFTSKAVAFEEHFNIKEKSASDFIPTKDTSSREIKEIADVLSGPEIFKIPLDSVPSKEQITQIWFTFNLVSNYINNKNLKPGGNPKKFVSWIEAVHVVYPENPYMALFLGLGCILLKDELKSSLHINNAIKLVNSSDYWKHRFLQFGLDKIISNIPGNETEVYNVLGELSVQYNKYIK